MKVLRFDDDRIGLLKGESRVVDVSDVIEARTMKGPQRSMEEFIERFDELQATLRDALAGQEGVPLDSVKLLPPIPRPSRCLAAFSNYLDTPERKAEDVPEEFFYKDPDLVGPEGSIALSNIPDVVVQQPEAELAYVIGRTGRNVPIEEAMDYVFGYVGFFDVSARGLTRRTQFIPKGQAGYAACGPWIATKDEVPDPHDLQVKSWVNGEARQDYPTSYMAVKIPQQVSWLSRFIQLHPGDVVATGTYHIGLGPINGGDVLEIEVVGIGKARFFVAGEGPKKLTEFRPGFTTITRPAAGMSRV